MIDQWALERLQIYQIVNTTWTMVSGTQTYLIGSGQAVDIARPVIIDHLNFIDTSMTPDLELPTTMITDDAWSNITQKLQTSPYPRFSYYNPTQPYGTLAFWPIPTSSSLQGSIYVPTALTEFTSLTQTITLPPGYRRMIVKNLAVELAPSYGVSPQAIQGVYQLAQEAKSMVKRANVRMLDMSIDPGALIGRGGAYDIYSDTWYTS